MLCAAGFNIRWLMRALLRQFSVSGLKHAFLGLMALWATLLNGLAAHLRAKAMQQRHPQARQALPSLLRRWPNGLVAAA